MEHNLVTGNEYRIAIVGAGPAGLSAAYFLQERGIRAVVYEAEGRIGGKSFSILNGDNMNEMGTCYTTRSHTMIKGWMKANDISLKRLGEARFDGQSVYGYVKQGPGAPLPLQVTRFIRKAGRLALTWARKPKAGDRVVDGERVQTLVAESAADLLEGKTIDVKAAEGKALLVVRRRRPETEAQPRRATARRTTRQAGATS